jgi:hypothetical protein
MDIFKFLIYIYLMTVTIEVMNQGTLNLLRDMEGLGLIHVNSLIPSRTVEKTEEGEKPSYHRLMGIHKDIPGASVENFLAHCRADKEHELEIERRQEEERAARRAGIHT